MKIDNPWTININRIAFKFIPQSYKLSQ